MKHHVPHMSLEFSGMGGALHPQGVQRERERVSKQARRHRHHSFLEGVLYTLCH